MSRIPLRSRLRPIANSRPTCGPCSRTAARLPLGRSAWLAETCCRISSLAPSRPRAWLRPDGWATAPLTPTGVVRVPGVLIATLVAQILFTDFRPRSIPPSLSCAPAFEAIDAAARALRQGSVCVAQLKLTVRLSALASKAIEESISIRFARPSVVARLAAYRASPQRTAAHRVTPTHAKASATVRTTWTGPPRQRACHAI